MWVVFPIVLFSNHCLYSREDSGVSTSDDNNSPEEKQNTDNVNNVLHEKNMSPDSSEDAAVATESQVIHDKIMYTSPHKLKQVKDTPDWTSIMGTNPVEDNLFSGQVDGRLNNFDDKYRSIAENFNLYDSSLPEDTLSDNNVSSSNNLIETSPEHAQVIQLNPVSKNQDSTTNVPHAEEPPLKKPIRKKRVTVIEEVTTSDKSECHSPLDIPNGLKKGILKEPTVEFPTFPAKELFIHIENLSKKKVEELVMLNEISTQIASRAFPKFSFKVCDFQSEKMAASYSNQAKSENFKEWRSETKNDNYIDEGM